jgi:hypothetical protein
MSGAVPEVALMLISREKNSYAICDAGKVATGRFLTLKDSWLQPQVLEFMRRCAPRTVLDPFVGGGDLLRVAARSIDCSIQGLDVQETEWPRNDSLERIPPLADGLILTNPPYLAKHSAKRKGVFERVEQYYRASGRDDLYQVALDKCLDACGKVVAIVPETVINSGYDLRHAVHVTVLHDNPFADTETPVCVVCLDRDGEWDADLYLDSRFVLTLSELNARRMRPVGAPSIQFNVRDGRIGFRAVDMPDPRKRLAFMPRKELDYDSAGIKVSSRLVTFVEMQALQDDEVSLVCEKANAILSRYRSLTFGLSMSPFKGNAKDGMRRRRLDYGTARAILERAFCEVKLSSGMPLASQQVLFA